MTTKFAMMTTTTAVATTTEVTMEMMATTMMTTEMKSWIQWTRSKRNAELRPTARHGRKSSKIATNDWRKAISCSMEKLARKNYSDSFNAWPIAHPSTCIAWSFDHLAGLTSCERRIIVRCCSFDARTANAADEIKCF